MPLAQLLAKQFPKHIQEKGRAYFYSGAVRVTEHGAGSAHARVRGTEPYEVDLDLDESLLHAMCTCPYVEEHGEPCKHIWATVLKLDAEHMLPEVEELRRLRIAVELDDDDYVDDDDYDEFDDYDNDGWRPQRQAYRPGRPAKPRACPGRTRSGRCGKRSPRTDRRRHGRWAVKFSMSSTCPPACRAAGWRWA